MLAPGFATRGAFQGARMTKADLVEKVTAQIARTAGPLISKKDCARVVGSFLQAQQGVARDGGGRERARQLLTGASAERTNNLRLRRFRRSRVRSQEILM